MKSTLNEKIGDDLYTVEEVAEFLRITPQTLYNWKLLGKGPKFVQVGSRIRYHYRDVAEFIEQNTHSLN